MNVCMCAKELNTGNDGANVAVGDKCADKNGGCSVLATCMISRDSNSCACKPGFTGDGYQCTGKMYTS